MRRAGFLGALAVCALLAAPAALGAPTTQGAPAAEMSIRIREAVIDPDGTTRLVVSVTGATGVVDLAAFSVRESGTEVTGVRAQPLSAASRPVLAMLVMDVSGSTAGRPLAEAIAGARAFVGRLPDGARAGVVAFGAKARVLVAPTADRARITRALGTLRAGGGTALYDGVVLAARQVASTGALGTLVVFSDGADTVSGARAADAVAAAKRVRAPVVAIGLPSGSFDGNALRSLATATEGRSVMVGEASTLSTVFEGAARDLATQFELRYAAPESAAIGDVVIEVGLGTAAARISDSVAASRARVTSSAAPTSPGERPRSSGPLVRAFADRNGMAVAGGAVFLGALLLLSLVLVRPKGGEALKVLQRGLRVYSATARGEAPTRSKGAHPFAALATGLVDKIPKPARYEERLQLRIDRAGWPLRASELLAIQIAAAFGGVLIALALLGRWWMGPVLAIVVGGLPRILLNRRITKRQGAFLEQLPDTLQLLAGSLQAGYGFLQAMDTLVRETPAPTSAEFSRVLTEARLGMPIEDALEAMADRFESEDLRWVVLAMNIQRQVGGNLAVLLHTVAGTLRERERVRRQIQVLSAEGKLSAWILGLLPVGIAGYIMLVNPGFLEVLTGEPVGRIMIAGAIASLGIGIVWMRKIIRIEV